MNTACFIGIDLSYTETGLSLIKVVDNVEQPPMLHSIKTKPKDSLIARQSQIIMGIKEFIATVKTFEHVFICIEGYAMGIKAGHTCDLSELGGLVKFLICKDTYETIIVAPTLLKKFVAQKGNVNKNIVMKEVYRLYGQDINNDNIADAFVLSKICLAFYGNPSKLFAWQRECVKNVQKLLDK